MNTDTLRPTTPSQPSDEASVHTDSGESKNLESYLHDGYRRAMADRPWRELGKTWGTAALVRVEAAKARRLAQQRESLKLHLGCADTYLEDWINIDLARPGRRLDVRWDLRKGLPFPTATVEASFSEHLFEHIPLPGALALLKECRRVTAEGGIIRIGVPDLERYIQAYLVRDDIMDRVRPGRPTRAIALNELFYFHGHRSMYDFETLALLLRVAGFGRVERSVYGESAIRPQPDSEHRQSETLYVEAVAE